MTSRLCRFCDFKTRTLTGPSPPLCARMWEEGIPPRPRLCRRNHRHLHLLPAWGLNCRSPSIAIPSNARAIVNVGRKTRQRLMPMTMSMPPRLGSTPTTTIESKHTSYKCWVEKRTCGFPGNDSRSVGFSHTIASSTRTHTAQTRCVERRCF